VSGWFKTEATDVESEHVYFKPVKLKAAKGRALLLSEFGGYSLPIEGHVFNPGKVYGYRLYRNREAWQSAIAALYKTEILPAIDSGLSGAILTQVSDVEDELNGLLTYDRQILKVDTEKMKNVADTLFERFSKRFGD